MVSIGLFLGAVVNANIFGELALILSEMNQEVKRFQLKISRANSTMIDLHLPFMTQQNVRYDLTTNDPSHQKQIEMIRFFASIKPSLKFKIIEF